MAAKIMKKIAIILLSFVFVSFSLLVGFSISIVSASESIIPYDIEKAMSQQAGALKAYEKIWNSFPKDDQGLPIYFEEYGGEYIENGKLVILLVEPNDANIEKYEALCDYSNDISFKKAEYSLSQLESYDELSRDLIKKYSLVSFGVDRKNNKYLIDVLEKDYLQVKEEILSRHLNNIIEIEISNPAICTANLYGGDKIVNTSNSKSFSNCIGGYYSGNEAVLTAGHNNEGYPSFTRSGNHIGQVWKQRCNTITGDTTINSLGDFAIIVMGGNYIGTNKVYNPTVGNYISITGTFSSVPTGTIIYKYGYSTGHSWGYVQQSSVTVQYSDPVTGLNTYYVRGLYKSYMQNSTGTDAVGAGDSGGCVYLNDGSYKIHGNVSGLSQPPAGSATHIMYSSPIYFAIDPQNVGFTPKTN